MNWSEFFYMDGYAFYVWTSYGVTAVILLANFFDPIIRGRQRRRRILGKIRRNSTP